MTCCFLGSNIVFTDCHWSADLELQIVHKTFEGVPFLSSSFYNKAHFFFFGCSGGSNAARIASSNTFFNPFCVSAEHSTYLTALNSRASFSAASTEIGFCLFLANFSIVPASSLKSTCVPTSRNGVLGQWWVISGTHCEEQEHGNDLQ